MVGLRIPITMCHGIRGAGTDGDQYALSEEHFEALVKTAHEVSAFSGQEGVGVGGGAD